MSARLAALQAMADTVADSYVDMSEVSKGGGGGRLLPAGYAMARLVRYIEFGMQPQEYQGTAKDPALEFRLGFAVWGDTAPHDPREPKDRPETLFHNPDGSPGFISTYDMKLSNNEKAGSKKAFDKMNWQGKARHFAQFLGEAFLVKIEHQDIKDQPGKKRARLVLADTLPPFDAVNRQPYPVPQAPDDAYELFLWASPTKESWDSLHIEGTNDQGKSKNYLQEKCLAALDFPGSRLEQLLKGGGDLPSPEQLAAPAAPAAPALPAASPLPADGAVATPVGTVNVATPAAPEAPAVAAPAVVAPALPTIAPPPLPVA